MPTEAHNPDQDPRRIAVAPPIDGGHLPPRAREALAKGATVDRRGSRRALNIAIVTALVERSEAAARAGDGRFRIGPYHLAQVPGSAKWYRFWYCKERGYDRKRSLGVTDFEEAKVLLVIQYCEENPNVLIEEGDLRVSLAVELYLRDPRLNEKWKGTYGTLLRAIDDTFPDITIGAFTRGRQKELIRRLRAGFQQGPLAASTIAGCMALANAAIQVAHQPDDDGRRSYDQVPLPVLADPVKIAKFLRIPPPIPRNWHPTFEQLGEIILRLSEGDEPEMAEGCRCWLLMCVAYACRPNCAVDTTSEQVDRLHGVYHLNPAGRLQEPRKYRPSLPLPPSLLAEIDCLPEGRIVGITYSGLYKRLCQVAEDMGLAGKLVPSSIRDFTATALRHAHLRYGIPRVPADEVEMWMGHRRSGINKRYGFFGPDYLLLARNAVECVLHDLDRLSGGNLLVRARRAGTLPTGPVVIDPTQGGGSFRAHQFSAKSEADPAAGEGDIKNVRKAFRDAVDHGSPWEVSQHAGATAGKSGQFGGHGQAFCQSSAKPGFGPGMPIRTDFSPSAPPRAALTIGSAKDVLARLHRNPRFKTFISIAGSDDGTSREPSDFPRSSDKRKARKADRTRDEAGDLRSKCHEPERSLPVSRFALSCEPYMDDPAFLISFVEALDRCFAGPTPSIDMLA